MNILIREYNPTDKEKLNHLSELVFDKPRGSFSLVEKVGHSRVVSNVVAVNSISDKIIGYGIVWEQVISRVKLRLEIIVEPEHRGKGVGSLLFTRLMNEIKEIYPFYVEVRVFEEHEEARQFFERRGFLENHRMISQLLQVKDVDLIPFSSIEKGLCSDGITMTTLKNESNSAPNAWELLEKLIIDTNSDFPNEIPVGLRTVNSNTSWIKDQETLVDAFFIAKYRNDYIGYSHIGRLDGQTTHLIQGNTAVLREYRGRNVATGLKMKCIEYAKNNGFNVLYTANRNTNIPMWRVNQKLGWKAYSSEIRFEMEIKRS
jgi:GNAT superfamily N-acetyltransferase